MSRTHISPSTASRDISSFQYLVERVYSSGSRLVATPAGLTSDISTILGCAQTHESFVDILRQSVGRQLESFGCGGRTLALWTCLFFKCIQDLKEEDIDIITINALLDVTLEYCIQRLEDIALPISHLPLSVLCDKLSHSVPEPGLVSRCCSLFYTSTYPEPGLKCSDVSPEPGLKCSDVSPEPGLKCSDVSPKPGLKCSDVSPEFIRHNVAIRFEKSDKPSEVFLGHLIKSGQVLSGRKRVLLVAGDIAPNSGHLGYKGIVKESAVKSAGKPSESPETWADKLTKMLHKLEVEVVISSGVCTIDFINTAISVLSGVSYNVLESISDNLNLNLIPSIEFVCPDDVITLEFEKCLHSWISIRSCDDPFYTILLRRSVSCGLEGRYKTFLSRLYHALKNKSVVPGAGKTEAFFSKILSSFALTEEDRTRYDLSSYSDDTSLISSIISQKLSELFQRVSSLTENNIQPLSDSTSDVEVDLSTLSLEDELSCEADDSTRDTIVYDEISSKVFAMKLALETARVLATVSLTIKPLSTDSESGS